MMGNHREIVMRDEGGVNARRIRVAYKPGGDFANPKWTSNPRFLTVAGPSAKPKAEIHIGRFDEDRTKVEQWVQLTRNSLFDTYAYAWIEPPGSAKARKTKEGEREKKRKAEEARKKRLADARKRKEVEERSWRSSRGRAVFLWETADKPVVAYDNKGRKIEGFNLRPQGLARLDHNYVMDVRKGSFVAEDAAAHVLSSCKKTSKLGIEAYITPADLSGKGTAEIVSFSTTDGRRNFALAQKQGELVFGVRATGQKGSWIRLFGLEKNRPCHVIVTYRRGTLVCYKNGRTIMMNTDVEDSIRSWKEGELVFGDNLSGKRNWDGLIEGVVVYARFVDAKSAARNYRNYRALVGERKPVPRLKVVGKLLAKSRAQEYKEIAPYFQELAVYEFEVKRVVSEEYAKKRIRVAHWVMMEKKLLPAARAAVGKKRRLVLEPFEANRQLEADYLSDTLPENRELPLYYDVGR